MEIGDTWLCLRWQESSYQDLMEITRAPALSVCLVFFNALTRSEYHQVSSQDTHSATVLHILRWHMGRAFLSHHLDRASENQAGQLRATKLGILEKEAEPF